jgi:hypothetical protein
MRVFAPDHIKPGWPAWWAHFKSAAHLALLMAAASIIVMAHAIAPFFLPEFANLFVRRLHRKLWPDSGSS